MILYFALSDSVEVTDEAEDEGGEEDEECRGPSARSGSGSHLESASRILLSESRRETYHKALNDKRLFVSARNFRISLPCPKTNKK